MTAEQWTRIFQREAKVSFDDAVNTLVQGMLREIDYHQSVLKAVRIWRHVAAETGVLQPNGLEEWFRHKEADALLELLRQEEAAEA